MCSTTIDEIDNKRDLSFTIMKALAVIFLVAAHAGGPAWLTSMSYLLGMPVLFIYAGFFFRTDTLEVPKTFLWNKFIRVYNPFWAWSVSFLVLHNLFSWIGLLPEQYYDWQEFFQNLWSITFNMSGYDPVMCGTFWFFRTLFIAGIVFYVLFYVIPKISRWSEPQAVASCIFCLCMGLTLWQLWGGLNVTGVAQGGYREFVALLLMSLGFLYRHYQNRLPSKWLMGIAGLVVLVVFAIFSPSAMMPFADVHSFLSLLVGAIGAFLVLRTVSLVIVEKMSFVAKRLEYIGDRMLYVLAFHLLAFKLVSIIKVLCYGLPWSIVGRYVIVAPGENDVFFLIYVVVGVALPLLVVRGWQMMDMHYNLTWYNCLKYAGKGLLISLLFMWRLIKRIGSAFWRSVKGFFSDMKDFIKASNPKDE